MRILINSKKVSDNTISSSFESLSCQLASHQIDWSPVIGIVCSGDIKQASQFGFEKEFVGAKIDWLHNRTGIIKILIERGGIVRVHILSQKQSMQSIERPMAVS